MKLLTYIICMFYFACAEGQTGTIKVKKDNCECMLQDSLVFDKEDFTKEISDTIKAVSIIGHISDSSGSTPITKASIYYVIEGKKVRLLSDEKGNFIILHLPKGSYTVFASAPCQRIESWGFSMVNESKVDLGFNIFMVPCEKKYKNENSKKPSKK